MSTASFLWARRDPLRMVETIATWPGDLAEVRIGRSGFILVRHPDLVQELLVPRAKSFVKGRTPERNRFFSFLGDGLLNNEGDTHTRQRRLTLPSFHRQRLATYADTIVRTVEASLGPWRAGQTRNLTEDMMRLTLLIVADTLFSAEMGAISTTVADGFESMMAHLNRMIFPGAGLLLRSPLPFARRMRQSQRELDQIVYGLIRSRRENFEDRGDLFSALLMAEDAERPGERLSDLEVRDQVMTLLFAGQETSANALAWMWWVLATQPDVEARLHEELARVLGARDPTFADLPALPYASQMVSEVLRMYPPVWTMGRDAIEDTTLGGFPVRRGTLVLASQWVVHRDPRWYDDPGMFRPERWTPEFQKALPRFAYFPFGGGGRSCIAENFAKSEILIVLATVARRWRLRASADTPRVAPQARVTLCQDPPVRLTLEARSG